MLKCGLCEKPILEHLTAAGGWAGCYDLHGLFTDHEPGADTFVLLLPDRRKGQGRVRWPFQEVRGVHGNGDRHEAPERATPAPVTPSAGQAAIARARFAYRAKTGKKQAQDAERLRGSHRRVYLVVSTEPGLTQPEIAAKAGIKESTAQHALWQLKKADLVDPQPL